MTPLEAAEIAVRQLLAESDYLEVRSAIPAIRAKRLRILEEAERELTAAVAVTLRAGACKASGNPALVAGIPDGTVISEDR